MRVDPIESNVTFIILLNVNVSFDDVYANSARVPKKIKKVTEIHR